MPQADAIFHNGPILTVDAQDTVSQAAAVTGNKISAVGSAEEVLASKGDGTRVVDLEGRALVPGFNDAHTHLELTSLGLGLAVSCHTPPHESIEDILTTLSEHAAGVPKGEWIIAQGSLFQDMRLREKRYPDRHDLDRVSVDHPILFKTSYHMVVVNSKVLEIAGITSDTPDPQGGIIERDSSGEPTGRMKDMYHRLPVPMPDYETVKDAIRRTVHDRFLANGVTTVQEMSETVAGLGAMRELIDSGEMPLRLSVYIHVPGTLPLENVLNREIGDFEFDDAWLRLGGVKLFIDGGFSARAAALQDPYEGYPDITGKLGYEDRELRRIVRKVHRAGLQLRMHTNGDRAIKQLIDAFETVFGIPAGVGEDWPYRHRAEHVGNVLLRDDLTISRLASAKILPVPNPAFIYSVAEFVAPYLGPERSHPSFRFRTLLDAGFRVPGSSDCTGTDPWLVNPMFGIWCMVNRRTYSGDLLEPEEKVSVAEAIRIYTYNSAYAEFQEEVKGSIEEGKLADLVVLDRDPITAPEETLKDIRVDQTWVDGKLVFSRDPNEESSNG